MRIVLLIHHTPSAWFKKHNFVTIYDIYLTPIQAVNSQTAEGLGRQRKKLYIYYTLGQTWLTAVSPLIKLTPLNQIIRMHLFIYMTNYYINQIYKIRDHEHFVFVQIYQLECIFFYFRPTYIKTTLQMRKKDRKHLENDMENSSYSSNILSIKMASFYKVFTAYNDVMFVIAHMF